MDRGKQAKGRASPGLAEAHSKGGRWWTPRLTLCPKSPRRKKARDVKKLLKERKEGT